MPRPKRRGSMLLALLLGVVGSAILSFILGYVSAASQHLNRFSVEQQEFLQGLVQGTRYRTEFEVWQIDPKHDPDDIAGEPESRCAGTYYPNEPVSMSGCVQGLTDPPPDGYLVPTARR